MSSLGSNNPRRILAIASGGGHWADLSRLHPIFDGLDVAFMSVHRDYARQVRGRRFYVMRDVSRHDVCAILILIPQLVRVLLKERPDVIITTGSAPALFALVLAKTLFRGKTKTIWVDQIANVEKLSMSGSLARYVSDVWLTQWPDLKTAHGPDYWGAVL
jgi:UDP-N-acetylglucosamine:LPS N-acetylglucosamine transferase